MIFSRRCRHDFVATDLVVLHGLVNDLFQVFVLVFTDLRRVLAHVLDVIDSGLCGNPAFRE
jgi:hypothetical protein